MFRKTIGFIMGVAALSLAGPAFAQDEDNPGSTAETDASVTIITPITLTNTTALQFGRVAKGTSGTNTVTLDTENGRAISGAGSATLAGGTATSAVYNVTGEPDQTFAIVLPSSLTLNPSSGDGAAITGTVTSASPTGTLSGAGAASFTLGGTLSIDNATVESGAYEGTFDVTVYYN